MGRSESGTLIVGTLVVAGRFDSLIERSSVAGIRRSSRGSYFPPWSDLDIYGIGRTTPVLQKSPWAGGLTLRCSGHGIFSCLGGDCCPFEAFLPNLQPVEFSDFRGTGGNALLVGDVLPFSRPTSTYPAVVFPLPCLSFKALTKGVDPRPALSAEDVDESLVLLRPAPFRWSCRMEAR